MQGLMINPGALPPEAEALRAEVRAFLADEMPAIAPAKRCRNWSGATPTSAARWAPGAGWA